MNQASNNIVEFNGRNILYRRINGEVWISVKSVCEALNVNYNRQYQNIQADPDLGPVFAKQQMQVPNDQPRNMVCLPESLIYGWIFQIKSDSEELRIYRRECYHVLFDHFHGKMADKVKTYTDIAKEKAKLQQLSELLDANETFLEWKLSKMRLARLWKDLRTSTENLIPGILDDID